LREYVQRRKALARIPELRDEFWHNLRVVGTGEELNQSLEKANRVRAHRLLLRGRDEERTRACNTEIRPPELTKISKIHAEKGQLRRWSRSSPAAFRFCTDRHTGCWGTEPTPRMLSMILFSPPTRTGTNSKGSRRCPGPAAVPLALLNFVEMLITLLPTREKIGIGTAFATAC